MILGQMHRRWYLSWQDGRVDHVEYETEDEAIAAREQWDDFNRKGICIMYHDLLIKEDGSVQER